MLAQRSDIILSTFTNNSLNWPHGPRSSSYRTGGDLIPTTYYLPSLKVVLLHLFAALKEYVLPRVWRLLNKEQLVDCQYLFYHLHCNSSNMSGRLWLWLTRELHSPLEEIEQVVLFEIGWNCMWYLYDLVPVQNAAEARRDLSKPALYVIDVIF